MTQGVMNDSLRRGKQHHTSCQSNSVVHGHVQGTGWVKGVASYNGCLGAATKISENIQADLHPRTKPKLLISSKNHRHKVKGEASSALRRQRRTSLGNGALKPVYRDSQGFQFDSSAKDGFKRKKIKSKKRDDKNTNPDKSTTKTSPPPEEDWENEIQEISNTGWNRMFFDFSPYDPEDVLQLSMSDMTLEETVGANRVTTSNYSPAIHHPLPIKWAGYSIPPEPEQFAEADG